MPPATVYADPCNGQFSHDQRKGCCPIEVSLNNAKITRGVRATTDLGVLPPTFLDVLTPGDAAYLRQNDHTTDLSFDMVSATHKELMEAVTDGRVTVDTAVGGFVVRLTDAADANERSEIRDYMGGLKEYRAQNDQLLYLPYPALCACIHHPASCHYWCPARDDENKNPCFVPFSVPL